MRELVVPKVPDPERYLPKARLVAEPKLRVAENGKTEVWAERNAVWAHIHAVGVETLEAVRDGLEFGPLVDRVAAATPEFRPIEIRALVRNYLWTFSNMGFIELDLAPAPDIFVGRYQRVQELGRGGLGIVHLCRDLKENQDVVVKHPWGVLHDISRGQRGLANEVRVLEVLDHPIVPRMVDTFEADGLLHLVREFTPGQDVQKHFAGTGVKDAAMRLDLAIQIADGICHLHERGLLFMDARPANYVLNGNRLQIIDFGSAIPHDDGVARVRGSKGSRGYTAPELRSVTEAGWREANLRTEVFSFGRLMYYLCTGIRPRRSWLEAQQAADLDERGIHGPERDLIHDCTRDRPEDRPADMGIVLDRLRSL